MIPKWVGCGIATYPLFLYNYGKGGGYMYDNEYVLDDDLFFSNDDDVEEDGTDDG